MTPGATERPRVGYKNYSNKGTDHTVIGYMKHKTSGGLCYMSIPYTAWR